MRANEQVSESQQSSDKLSLSVLRNDKTKTWHHSKHLFDDKMIKHEIIKVSLHCRKRDSNFIVAFWLSRLVNNKDIILKSTERIIKAQITIRNILLLIGRQHGI